MADASKDSSATPSPSTLSAAAAPSAPSVTAPAQPATSAPALAVAATPKHPTADEALAQVVLGTDTEVGYHNAAAASKGAGSTSVAVYLKQKGHLPHQVPGFVKKMEEKFSGAAKTAVEWTKELEAFLQRKIH